MRTDKSVSRKSFRFSKQWETDALRGTQTPEIDQRLSGGELVDGKFIAHSLSGNERNHLFLNHHGEKLSDISAISGLDTPGDSRGFVLWDYDHDGWQDIAVVNANAPLLNLYHNEIKNNAGFDVSQYQSIALRFVGGNQSDAPSSTFACRAGFGAIAVISAGSLSLKREHRCGEGYGSQNSKVMIVGIGKEQMAHKVNVRWPSGKNQSIENVAAGTLLTIYENPQASPNGTAFVSQPYQSRQSSLANPLRASRRSKQAVSKKLVIGKIRSIPPKSNAQPKLRIFTTMATWCASCRQHLPQLKHLKETVGSETIEIVAVPVDEKDDLQKLTAYVAKWQPPYRMLLEIDSRDRSLVKEILADTFDIDALPSTIITDSSGNVLNILAGVPTVSQIRKLLSEQHK